jgi:hypothetical protein
LRFVGSSVMLVSGKEAKHDDEEAYELELDEAGP